MKILDLIIKKQQGLTLTKSELEFAAKGAAQGSIPDYQLSAFLKVCYFKSLNEREITDLTRAMAFSGRMLKLEDIKKPKADKHSTGGVGDGISLALAPLVAGAGVVVPMMSGRGLGHTGGTLDKLEAIKGFKVNLSSYQIKRQLKQIGVCMFSQSDEIVPADKKLYALRDVTASVNSLPLMTCSILSKKYAEGAENLVMDVKYGSGSMLIDYAKCRHLAKTLVKTAKDLKMRAAALLTNMEQPIGRAVGLGLETAQAIKVLQGDRDAKDYYELMLELGAYMLVLSGKAQSLNYARSQLETSLTSGRALEKMRQIIKCQNGYTKVIDNPDKFLPKSKYGFEFKAAKTGYIKTLDAKKIGLAANVLGAGRYAVDDKLDYGAGILLEYKIGDFVKKGIIIARLYSSDDRKLMQGKKMFSQAVAIDADKVIPPVLIKEVIK